MDSIKLDGNVAKVRKTYANTYSKMGGGDGMGVHMVSSEVH